MVGLDIGLIFNGDIKAVIGIHLGVDQALDQKVGKGKIVIGRIGFVGIKIPENIGDIHKATAAKDTAHVMEPGKGNAGLRHVVEIFRHILAAQGRLAAGVHGLHGFDHLVQINGCG